jgi:hypothetical protein
MPKGAEPPDLDVRDHSPVETMVVCGLRLGDFGTVHFKQGVWNLSDRPKGVPLEGPSASYRDPSGRVWLGLTQAKYMYLMENRLPLTRRTTGSM